jgi:hypothetical protein
VSLFLANGFRVCVDVLWAACAARGGPDAKD